eukprot:Rhum_TRINITY_DN14977_c11_g3::Rhum_TRINITY_DN14977_c11_g3_i2::g.132001::m.132001
MRQPAVRQTVRCGGRRGCGRGGAASVAARRLHAVLRAASVRAHRAPYVVEVDAELVQGTPQHLHRVAPRVQQRVSLRDRERVLVERLLRAVVLRAEPRQLRLEHVRVRHAAQRLLDLPRHTLRTPPQVGQVRLQTLIPVAQQRVQRLLQRGQPLRLPGYLRGQPGDARLEGRQPRHRLLGPPPRVRAVHRGVDAALLAAFEGKAPQPLVEGGKRRPRVQPSQLPQHAGAHAGPPGDAGEGGPAPVRARAHGAVRRALERGDDRLSGAPAAPREAGAAELVEVALQQQAAVVRAQRLADRLQAAALAGHVAVQVQKPEVALQDGGVREELDADGRRLVAPPPHAERRPVGAQLVVVQPQQHAVRQQPERPRRPLRPRRPPPRRRELAPPLEPLHPPHPLTALHQARQSLPQPQPPAPLPEELLPRPPRHRRRHRVPGEHAVPPPQPRRRRLRRRHAPRQRVVVRRPPGLRA